MSTASYRDTALSTTRGRQPGDHCPGTEALSAQRQHMARQQGGTAWWGADLLVCSVILARLAGWQLAGKQTRQRPLSRVSGPVCDHVGARPLPDTGAEPACRPTSAPSGCECVRHLRGAASRRAGVDEVGRGGALRTSPPPTPESFVDI